MISCGKKILLASVFILISGCMKQSIYVDADDNARYMIKDKKGHKKLSLLPPEGGGGWYIFKGLLDGGEHTAIGGLMSFRGNGGGGGTQAMLNVSLNEGFQTNMEVYQQEMLQQEVVVNTDEMLAYVNEVLACDSVEKCPVFEQWHQARLQWMIDRNKNIPEFKGYNERGGIVKFRDLWCSKIEHEEGQRSFVAPRPGSKVHEVNYPFRRWTTIPTMEYVSQTVCPVVFNDEIKVFTIYYVQAEFSWNKKEKRQKNIIEVERRMKRSLDSIQFYGDIKQTLN